MAPSPPTEDYYAVLEVTPGATADMIKKSYRRLALKLHPTTTGVTMLCPDSNLYVFLAGWVIADYAEASI